MDELIRENNSETFSASEGGSPQGNNQRTPIRFDFQVDDNRSSFAERDLGHDLFFLQKHLSSTTKPRNSISSYSLFIAKSAKRIIRTITGKQSIEIVHVINTCQTDLKTFLWGWINPPVEEDLFSGFAITVGGWVLGKKLQPTAIRFLVNQAIVIETPIDVPRPDVVKLHFTEKVKCGFGAVIDLEPFPNSSELLLQAIFPDNTTAALGTIKYRKYG